MKYYKLTKTNGKLIEIKREDMEIDINKPAKIYQNESAYFGIGEASRKFLKIIERAQFKNKKMEDYWDKVANNWVEKIEKKED